MILLYSLVAPYLKSNRVCLSERVITLYYLYRFALLHFYNQQKLLTIYIKYSIYLAVNSINDVVSNL